MAGWDFTLDASSPSSATTCSRRIWCRSAPTSCLKSRGACWRIGFRHGPVAGALQRVDYAAGGPGSRAGMLAGARTQGARRLPVQVLGGVAEHLPFPDACFDAVVSTCTLCTVRDPAMTLEEIARVLVRPGRFHFLEHGMAGRRRSCACSAGWNRYTFGWLRMPSDARHSRRPGSLAAAGAVVRDASRCAARPPTSGRWFPASRRRSWRAVRDSHRLPPSSLRAGDPPCGSR
ncbi:class I SAM-dependent methyltransferase [bacterium]|nr:class I SAM-dependent methyltransferase [bacterium]